MASHQSSFDRFLQFFSSLKCGLLLLGLLGITVILGTFILQKPMAQEGQIEQVYAPQVVRLLSVLGLFDVFHAWWFILLLGLLGANITLASIERFPQAWRLFVRPHFLADEAFIRALPFQRELPLGPHTPKDAMGVASLKLASLGYPPRPDILSKGTLYVEKHRLVRLAPYVVHASLLIIFAGAIFDGTHGYRGFISLRPGMSTDVVEPLTMPGARHHLDFTLRCDGTGMDPYPDGSPRQYWSQLAVLAGGREVARKKIYVNDPLTYKGVRFFQASYSPAGSPRKLVMEASWMENGAEKHQVLALAPGAPAPLGEQGANVELADFIPDYVLEGNQITSRSDEPRNPAIHLQVTRADSQPTHAWVLAKSPELHPPNNTGIDFRFVSVEMDSVTGLQVAHEPGQWLIWAGCLLLTTGLMMALYLSHIRIWGIVAANRKGQPILLLGGQPSKYRENFERKFHELTDEVEAVILLLLGYLAYTGVQDSKSYYVTIKELRTMGDGAYSKRLRVAGNVQPGSIKRTGTHVQFVLVEQDQNLSVDYTGTEPPPDTFKDDSQALADGSFGHDGVFHAKALQAKCASKYAPQQPGSPANGMQSAEPAKSMTQAQPGTASGISN